MMVMLVMFSFSQETLSHAQSQEVFSKCELVMVVVNLAENEDERRWVGEGSVWFFLGGEITLK